jgi:hypothetical protein
MSSSRDPDLDRLWRAFHELDRRVTASEGNVTIHVEDGQFPPVVVGIPPSDFQTLIESVGDDTGFDDQKEWIGRLEVLIPPGQRTLRGISVVVNRESLMGFVREALKSIVSVASTFPAPTANEDPEPWETLEEILPSLAIEVIATAKEICDLYSELSGAEREATWRTVLDDCEYI